MCLAQPRTPPDAASIAFDYALTDSKADAGAGDGAAVKPLEDAEDGQVAFGRDSMPLSAAAKRHSASRSSTEK